MTKKIATLRLGEIFALIRESKGLTIRKLESMSGVSNALISQIETGKIADPGFSTVIRISRALGISLDRCAAPYVDYLDAMKGVLRDDDQARPASRGKE